MFYNIVIENSTFQQNLRFGLTGSKLKMHCVLPVCSIQKPNVSPIS